MISKIIIGGLTRHTLTTMFNITMLAFGTTIISLILVLNYSYNQKIKRDLQNVDIVAGAKGSPLQLVLSGVYHIDYPSDDISMKKVESLGQYSGIKTITPIAFNGHFKDTKILGTETSYLEKYGAQPAQGRMFTQDFEVVIGDEVQKSQKLGLNDNFVETSDNDWKSQKYPPQKYKVVGVLAKTNTVLDYLIVSNLHTVWTIARHNQSDSSLYSGDRVSVALLELYRPTDQEEIVRKINRETNLLAAAPTSEINRLSHLTGLGTTLLEGIAWSIVFLAALSIFITVQRKIQDRKYELAIMRLVGATRYNLINIILIETWITTTIGYLVGMGVSRLGIWILQNKVIQESTLTIAYKFTPSEKYLLPILLILSTVAVVMPLIYVFRLNVSKILAEE
ncbi:MAG: ABC transporter permease [Chitinophagales bacterium]|nr:ABC transporter permease [Chitinophagales bacterium]